MFDLWRGGRPERPLSLPESRASPKKNHRSDRSGLRQQHDQDPEQDDEVRVSLSTEALLLSRRYPNSRKGLEFNSRPHGQLYGLSPDDVLAGKMPDKHLFSEKIEKARAKRPEINRNQLCDIC